MKAVLMAVGTWFTTSFIGRVLVLGTIAGIVKIAVGIGLGRIIGILGVGTIAFQGVSNGLDYLVQEVGGYIALMSPEEYKIASMTANLLHLDQCLTIIFTAYATVFALWTFKGAWRAFNIGGGGVA